MFYRDAIRAGWEDFRANNERSYEFIPTYPSAGDNAVFIGGPKGGDTTAIPPDGGLRTLTVACLDQMEVTTRDINDALPVSTRSTYHEERYEFDGQKDREGRFIYRWVNPTNDLRHRVHALTQRASIAERDLKDCKHYIEVALRLLEDPALVKEAIYFLTVEDAI